jgi:hypothetical protein
VRPEQVEEVVERVAGLTRDILASCDRHYGEPFDVGVVAVVLDLDFEDGVAVTYNCSDERPWVHAGLFRRAMLGADSEDVHR